MESVVSLGEIAPPIPENFALSADRTAVGVEPSPEPLSPIRIAQSDSESERPKPKTSRSKKELLWWAVLGFGTLLAAGAFVGAFYWLTRPLEEDEPSEAEAFDDELAHKDLDVESSEEIQDEKAPPSDREASGQDDRPLNLPQAPQIFSKPPPPTPPPPVDGGLNGYNDVAGSDLSPMASGTSQPPAPVPTPPTTPMRIEPTHSLPNIDRVEALIAELQHCDPQKRSKIIWELTQCGDSRAIEPLVNLMVECDSQQRSAIVAAIAKIGTRVLQPMNRGLSVALKDRNPDVRKNAIRDITLFYDLVLQISQFLQHAVDDTDEDVRQAATWAVSQLTRFQGRADLESRSALPSWSHPPEAPEDIP